MRLISSICLIAAVGPFLRATDCYLIIANVKTIDNVFRAVLANDMDWYRVLKLDVKVDRNALDAPQVDILDKLEVYGPAVRVQKLLSYLVTHPGSTGSQITLGVRVLGAGVWCQLMGTLLVHTKLASMYARRAPVNVDDIRLRMSRIQAVLPGYVDKLSFFGQPINGLVSFNNKINALFKKHDTAVNTVKKGPFVNCLESLYEDTKKLMAEKCGTNDDKVIGDTLKIQSYDNTVFDKEARKNIVHQQMLAMIDHLDKYEFIDVKTMDKNMWMKQMKIVLSEQEDGEFINNNY